MIYSLEGPVTEIFEDTLILDLQGVGYQVFVPVGLRESAGLGEILKVYTYHHIREDQQTLFGFPSLADRQLFMLLTTVSGMGPKIAMKALSALPAESLIHAIATEDHATLTSLPGVGKKLAERLVIELKDKLPATALTLPNTQRGPIRSNPVIDDLMMALRSLGYSNDEIKRALSQTDGLEVITDVQSGIKLVLKGLK